MAQDPCDAGAHGWAWIAPDGTLHVIDRHNAPVMTHMGQPTHKSWAMIYLDVGPAHPGNEMSLAGQAYTELLDRGWIAASNAFVFTGNARSPIGSPAWDTALAWAVQCAKKGNLNPERPRRVTVNDRFYSIAEFVEKYGGRAWTDRLFKTLLGSMQTISRCGPSPPYGRITMGKTIRAIVIRAVSDMADYEKAADRVAEYTGGTAKVWGPDALLVEDAGPGIHMHWEHGGETLEIWAGSAHPEQLVQWMEVRLQAATSDPEVLQMDLQKVANDPGLFAKFVAAVLHTQNIRAKAVHHKVHIAGRRDMIMTTQLLLSEASRDAIQKYFAETTAPPDPEAAEPVETPATVPGADGGLVDPDAEQMPPGDQVHTIEVGDDESETPEEEGEDPLADGEEEEAPDGDGEEVDGEEAAPEDEENPFTEEDEDPAPEDGEEKAPEEDSEEEAPEEEPFAEEEPEGDEEDPFAGDEGGEDPEEDPFAGDEGEEDPEGPPEDGEEAPEDVEDSPEDGEDGDDGGSEFDELLKEVGTDDEDPDAIEEPLFNDSDQEDLGGEEEEEDGTTEEGEDTTDDGEEEPEEPPRGASIPAILRAMTKYSQ